MPELGCYGHKEFAAGVRNYGKRDPKELFDVYCFARELDGKTQRQPEGCSPSIGRGTVL